MHFSFVPELEGLREPKWGYNDLGYLVYLRTYARTKSDGTLETWPETLRRVIAGNIQLEIDRLEARHQMTDAKLAELEAEAQELFELFYQLIILPPGRGLWMSGTPFAARVGEGLFNCYGFVVDDLHVLAEIMEVLMMGGGIGARIARDAIEQLPEISARTNVVFSCRQNAPCYEEVAALLTAEPTKESIVIPDSREGWADALYHLLYTAVWSAGETTLNFDVSHIRPKGQPIRGFGGVASGPLPLMQLLSTVGEILNRAYGRQLTSVEVGDIVQNIGVCVVAGNVRRSAIILLGDADDDAFIQEKDYSLEQNKYAASWRWASNNSVIVGPNTPKTVFEKIAENLFKTGEPGIFNPTVSQNYGRLADGMRPGIDAHVQTVNPCGEVPLNPYEPCNLFEINLPALEAATRGRKPGLPGFSSLMEEVAYLSARWTYRTTLAKFQNKHIQEVVATNHRTGVGLTGITDWLTRYYHGCWNAKAIHRLDRLYQQIRQYNVAFAKSLGLPPSIKVTTVKPSGTLSTLFGVSPGIHYHWAPYMIRRIRIAANSPLVPYLLQAGYPVEYQILSQVDGETTYDYNTMVFSFPIKALTADHPDFQSEQEVSLAAQAENQQVLQTVWSDNAVSITLKFNPEVDTAEEIAELLYENRGTFKSTSLLPAVSGTYPQMPFEAITAEEYNRLVEQIKTPLSKLLKDVVIKATGTEDVDGSMECDGGACPIR